MIVIWWLKLLVSWPQSKGQMKSLVKKNKPGSEEWRLKNSESSKRQQKKTKNLIPWKGMSKRSMYLIKQKQVEGKHTSVATTTEALMNHGGIQPVARGVQVEGMSHFKNYAEATTGRYQNMTKMQNSLLNTWRWWENKRWQQKNLMLWDQNFQIA